MRPGKSCRAREDDFVQDEVLECMVASAGRKGRSPKSQESGTSETSSETTPRRESRRETTGHLQGSVHQKSIHHHETRCCSKRICHMSSVISGLRSIDEKLAIRDCSVLDAKPSNLSIDGMAVQDGADPPQSRLPRDAVQLAIGRRPSAAWN